MIKHSTPELRKMCADAKLPKAGNKAQLMASLVWGWRPTHETLGKKTIAEMRKMCVDMNLLKTGTKEQLMDRLIDPGHRVVKELNLHSSNFSGIL